MKIFGKNCFDILRFVFGCADMHPTDTIHYDGEEGDPKPLGYEGAFLLAWLVIGFAIGHYSYLHANTTAPRLEYAATAGAMLGFVSAASYAAVMTFVNWITYAVRMLHS